MDAMNNLGVWMIWMILGLGPIALNAMSSSSLLFTRTTLGHELRVLDAIITQGS